MNRRHFMQAMLTAGIAPALVRYTSLMRPRMSWSYGLRQPFEIVSKPISDYLHAEILTPNEVRARLGLPILEMSDLEFSLQAIGVLPNYLTSYRYYLPQLVVGLPQDVKARRVWCDGVELPRSAWQQTEQGILFQDMDLAPYGNRVPDVTAEVTSKEPIVLRESPPYTIGQKEAAPEGAAKDDGETGTLTRRG